MARTTWGPLSTDEQNSIEFAPVGEPGVLVAGTAGGLLKRNADGTMGNSILSESGSVLTAAGSLRFSLTTEAGLRFNNLTTTQRNALTGAAGDAVWNTTTTRLNVHNGSAWTDGFVRLAGDTMTGPLVIPDGSLSAASVQTSVGANYGLYKTSFSRLGYAHGGTSKVALGDGLFLGSTTTLNWTTAGAGESSADTILQRGAANTLDLRNLANAQTWNVYGTYTDASNYRRLRSTMSTGGAATIAAEGLGTGVSGNTLTFAIGSSAAPTTVLAFSTAGAATFGASVIAPAGNAFAWSGRSIVTSPADGSVLVQNQAGSDADFFLKLGVNTSAAAGIKRVASSTVLQARLNDDSAFATIQGKLRTDNAYVAGAVVGTGYVTITDSTGTAYRVPVLV